MTKVIAVQQGTDYDDGTVNNARNEEMKMTYVITEPCGGCKDRGCVEVCPCDCIEEGTIEQDGNVYNQLFIDPDVCIHCGRCEPECPVDAIFEDDEVPTKWAHFIPINAAFYRRKSKQVR